jgi:hypothetical protein
MGCLAASSLACALVWYIGTCRVGEVIPMVGGAGHIFCGLCTFVCLWFWEGCREGFTTQ